VSASPREIVEEFYRRTNTGERGLAMWIES
jgi:hypothetical protein